MDEPSRNVNTERNSKNDERELYLMDSTRRNPNGWRKADRISTLNAHGKKKIVGWTERGCFRSLKNPLPPPPSRVVTAWASRPAGCRGKGRRSVRASTPWTRSCRRCSWWRSSCWTRPKYSPAGGEGQNTRRRRYIYLHIYTVAGFISDELWEWWWTWRRRATGGSPEASLRWAAGCRSAAAPLSPWPACQDAWTRTHTHTQVSFVARWINCQQGKYINHINTNINRRFFTL